MILFEAEWPLAYRAVGAAEAPDRLIEAVEAQMRTLTRAAPSLAGEADGAAQRAVAHHLSSGGHRIRAQLAVHASLALELSAGDAVALATTAELAHNASLVHDDLQDRDTTRRGMATVWAAYGDGVAICAGDALLSAAYCALAAVSRTHLLPTLMTLLHRRITDACTGQCVDLTNMPGQQMSFDHYKTTSALKSGSLLALPIELSLVAAGQSKAVPRASRAAELFAVAYQIFDDLKDVKTDLMRATAQPAMNVVAVMQACHPLQDARALACQHALACLDEAAEASLSLPGQSGQLLRQLAHDLSVRFARDAA